jgi:hypothetical protein
MVCPFSSVHFTHVVIIGFLLLVSDGSQGDPIGLASSRAWRVMPNARVMLFSAPLPSRKLASTPRAGYA